MSLLSVPASVGSALRCTPHINVSKEWLHCPRTIVLPSVKCPRKAPGTWAPVPCIGSVRLLGVVVCPGLKDAGLQGLRRKHDAGAYRKCLLRENVEALSKPEDSTGLRGKWSPVESSTSPDGASSEGEADVESTSDQPFFQDVQIGLNLPRRRMLVEFTCNKCNSRTQRVINPEAYRRGTVFVQCGGCEVTHQIVDNLNLIQEFDFREDEGLT